MQVEDTINNDELSLYENYRIEVDKGQSLLRIDKFLMARLEGTSRNKIQMAARANCIKVNDNAVKPNYRVKPGDVISSVTRCHFADRTFSGEEITYYTAKGVFLRGTAYGTLTIQTPARIPISLWPVYLAEKLKNQI